MATITSRVVKNAREKGVTVYGHRQWGSLSIPTYAIRRRTRKHHLLPEKPADTLWQHISVTHDTGRSRASFKRDMRTLERIGNQRFLVGVSYNLAWDAVTGEIGVGQPLDAKGAHTLNHKNIPGYSFDQNAVSLAITVIGMPGVKPTEKAVRSLILVIRALIEEGALTPDFDYNPHSMVAAKSCPTKNLTDIMPSIYKEATRPPEPNAPHVDHAIEDIKTAINNAKGPLRRQTLTEVLEKLQNL